MNNKRNFYRLLQVQPDAPDEIIRASYRTLMQKLRMHPDLGGDSNTAALLNQAYETLIDRNKRAAYDRQLEISLHRQRRPSPAKHAGTGHSHPATHFSKCPFCHMSQPRFNRNSANRSCTSCLSPLQLSEKKTATNQGKRSIYRIPHGGRINFCTSWPRIRTHQALIDDLSPNGLLLRSRLQLAPGRIVKLFNDNLQAIGKVVRCHPDSTADYYRIGIEFVTLRFENKTGSFLSAKV